MNADEVKKIQSLVDFLNADIAFEDEVIVANKDPRSFKFLGIDTFVKRKSEKFAGRFKQIVRSYDKKTEDNFTDSGIDDNDTFIIKEVINSWVKYADKLGVKVERDEILEVMNKIELAIQEFQSGYDLRKEELREISSYARRANEWNEDNFNNEGLEDYLEVSLDPLYPVVREVKSFTSAIKKRIALNHPFIMNNNAQDYCQISGVKSHQSLNSGVVDFLKKKVDKEFNVPEPSVLNLNKSLDFDQALIFEDKSVALRNSRTQKYTAIDAEKYPEAVKSLVEMYVQHIARKRPKLGKAISDKLAAEGYKVEEAINVYDKLTKYRQLFREFDVSAEDLVNEKKTYEQVYDFIQNLSYKNEIRKYRKSFISKKYEFLVNEKTEGLFEELYQAKIPRSFVEDGLIKRIAAFRNAESFNESLGNLVTSLNSFSKESYKVKAETQNADIVYEDEDSLILRVYDHEAVSSLGAARWCIKDEVYFNNYVTEEGNAQYIAYDFDEDPQNGRCIVGVTMDDRGDIESAYDKFDHEAKYEDAVSDLRSKIIPNDSEFFKNLSEENKVFLGRNNKRTMGLR